MTKSELIDRVSENQKIPKVHVEKIVRATFETISQALQSGDKFSMANFGTFDTRHVAEKKCRNPRTGDPITVPPRTNAVFRPGRELKHAVNV